jgi:hypothetical protein
MKYDDKQFLDLLQEYKSDETRKARRNVSVIAFVVISAALVNIQLTEVSVLGVNLRGTSPLSVLILATVLLVYWTTMFLLAWSQDNEIQKERSLSLDAYVKPILEQFELYEKQKAELENRFDYKELKATVEAYRRQQQRTARATKLGRVIRAFEVVVPLALASVAAVVLARWIYAAL